MAKGKKFCKLHMIVHVFGEGIKIPKIAYDSPCFCDEKEILKIAYDIVHIFGEEKEIP